MGRNSQRSEDVEMTHILGNSSFPRLLFLQILFFSYVVVVVVHGVTQIPHTPWDINFQYSNHMKGKRMISKLKEQ